MTFGGWIFMTVTCGIIIALVAFCYSRIFKDKERDIQAR